MVCTGGLLPVIPPRRSVKPPSADNDVNALSAPGLDRSCAKGIALANGDGPLVEDWLVVFPVEEPPGVDGFWASRFAFWSSTLNERGKDRFWLEVQLFDGNLRLPLSCFYITKYSQNKMFFA